MATPEVMSGIFIKAETSVAPNACLVRCRERYFLAYLSETVPACHISPNTHMRIVHAPGKDPSCEIV